MEYAEILAALRDPDGLSLFQQAAKIRRQCVGDRVYLRGLLEVSNVCVERCEYCGLRKGNTALPRYKLNASSVLDVADSVARAGIWTIVIQAGDGAYRVEEVCEWVSAIKSRYPSMAVTLSLGERPVSDYAAFRSAGADRYLLKFETSDRATYEKLRPGKLLSQRLQCLSELKRLGFQVGTGFIVGLPGQTLESLAHDLLLLCELDPDMVAIGPFMPQQNTPLANHPAGGLEITLRCLALARILTEVALIPATTALQSLDPYGLERGLEAGANVVMVNFTPSPASQYYRIYDGRLRLSLKEVRERIAKIGLEASGARGDSPRACARNLGGEVFLGSVR